MFYQWLDLQSLKSQNKNVAIQAKEPIKEVEIRVLSLSF